MDVKRLVWIAVIALIVTVAFVGGFALGTWNSGRVQYAGVYAMAPGFGARGLAPSGIFTPTVPFSRSIPFGYAPGWMMQPGFERGHGMMPGFSRGGGMQFRFLPGRSMPGNWRRGWR